ncbi:MULTISPECIES: hypothetical protein [Mycobacterium]|uniref:Secreted protein n=1 Tax=Mycobacterium kiyosense TaxID=2871094 RepID=A0A9P3UZV9_9MYCO|nr:MULTISPECIES: hypothetical protein [Mycobacterium]BDB43811.1 hypothetical protein IWGMT90018_42570 [Mycobacterium kiyosense]BDE15372.1 hypothetical protein MKCMC460_42320 [Mycobacterium sp. 20KCMC460]GLB82740.1 hypothetical protein SRL2020028_19960 [Mycobacterium kiyosense]GLB90203.1 hypothetical protein SRL2020130_30200 [Mycobacterium kiyosense]GLB95792.1 hypothetical protein SRL2020226_25680 [Mycobacterium kiyosense]
MRNGPRAGAAIRARRVGAAFAVVAALSTTVPAAADPPSGADAIDAYPLAQGHFSSAGDFYWKFFKTPDGRSCAIAPNGGVSGCDAVPIVAPAGTNQTVVSSWAAAQYRHADPPGFARDVDVLPEGQRLENWGTTCGVGYQGTVTCKAPGSHGFILASTYAALW